MKLFLPLLQVALIVLKIMGYITAGWGVVFLPMILWLGLAILVWLIAILAILRQ